MIFPKIFSQKIDFPPRDELLAFSKVAEHATTTTCFYASIYTVP